MAGFAPGAKRGRGRQACYRRQSPSSRCRGCATGKHILLRPPNRPLRMQLVLGYKQSTDFLFQRVTAVRGAGVQDGRGSQLGTGAPLAAAGRAEQVSVGDMHVCCRISRARCDAISVKKEVLFSSPTRPSPAESIALNSGRKPSGDGTSFTHLLISFGNFSRGCLKQGVARPLLIVRNLPCPWGAVIF